jgi:hypothetical protein
MWRPGVFLLYLLPACKPSSESETIRHDDLAAPRVAASALAGSAAAATGPSASAVPPALPSDHWTVTDEAHARAALAKCAEYRPTTSIRFELAAEATRPVWVAKVNQEYCNVSAVTGRVACEGSFCSARTGSAAAAR